jgi:hypothetical protein
MFAPHLFNIRAFLLLICLCLLSFPLFAKPVTIPQTLHYPAYETATYKIKWASISLGAAEVIWSESDTQYSVLVELQTAGIVRLFKEQDLVVRLKGIKKRIGNTIRYIPQYYRYHNERPKKTRDVRINYGEHGLVHGYVVMPPENPGSRPEIPVELQHQAHDPLTGLLQFIAEAAYAGQDISVTIFDGRRMTAILGNRMQEQAEDGKVRYTLSRKPIAGYSEKKRKKMKDDSKVTGLFAPLRSRLPLSLQAYTFFGTVHASRVKQ